MQYTRPVVSKLHIHHDHLGGGGDPGANVCVLYYQANYSSPKTKRYGVNPVVV